MYMSSQNSWLWRKGQDLSFCLAFREGSGRYPRGSRKAGSRTVPVGPPRPGSRAAPPA